MSLNQLVESLPDCRRMKVIREALKSVELELEQIESGGRPIPEVTYEDPPDMRPLKSGYQTDLLRHKYFLTFLDAPGSCYKRFGMSYFSCWYMNLFLGNYTAVNRMIAAMSDQERNQHLKKREGMSKLSAIFLPITGARCLQAENWPGNGQARPKTFPQPGHEKLSIEYRHLELFEMIINLGADINAVDSFGFTPLIHCFIFKNDYTMKIAAKLLEAGADPNKQDRFGFAPLTWIMSLNPSVDSQDTNLEAVQLLMKYGADPYLTDMDGKTAFGHANLGDFNPGAREGNALKTIIKTMFYNNDEDDAERVSKIRAEARQETDFQKCGKCKMGAKKRCTGCYLVWYCSSACQKSHWKNHKPTCHEIVDEYEEVEVVVNRDFLFHESFKTGKTYEYSNQPPTTSFVVKICLSRDPLTAKILKNHPMGVCNKDRTVFFHMNPKSCLAKKVTKIIINNDKTNRLKGYFYCVVTGNGKYRVNPTILPEEKW